MSKKTFIQAAKQIQDYREQGMSQDIIDAVQEAFCQLFTSDNPRFDKDRFIAYCQK